MHSFEKNLFTVNEFEEISLIQIDLFPFPNRCSSCGLRHPRKPTGRPHFAARQCNTCKIRHTAREVCSYRLFCTFMHYVLYKMVHVRNPSPLFRVIFGLRHHYLVFVGNIWHWWKAKCTTLQNGRTAKKVLYRIYNRIRTSFNIALSSAVNSNSTISSNSKIYNKKRRNYVVNKQSKLITGHELCVEYEWHWMQRDGVIKKAHSDVRPYWISRVHFRWHILASHLIPFAQSTQYFHSSVSVIINSFVF